MSIELEKRIRRLELALIGTVVAGAICTLLVFAHLMHDTHEFAEIWKAIHERHQHEQR